MTLAEKLTLIAQNEQKVYNAGYEKGKSEGGGGSGGEKPTLFAPSIKINSVTSELTITDDRNGDFEIFYDVYAGGNKITTLTSKTATLADYMEHTETIEVKVQATSINFNPSDYAIAEWKYVNVDGTPGLAYSLSSDGTYAICTGIGDAVVTDIVIASAYEGVPVESIELGAFNGNSNIKSVFIPPTVTTIGAAAFASCESLARIDLSTHTVVPRLESWNAFHRANADLQIKVPANLIDSWKSATNWADNASKIVTEFTNTL